MLAEIAAANAAFAIIKNAVQNTGDITSVYSLDEDWVTLNQMIKYYKYGFGRVSDHVNESIRWNLITREEGIKLVEEYDGACGEEYIADFCKYIEISIDEFWENVHNSLNKELFDLDNTGKITRKFIVGEGIK